MTYVAGYRTPTHVVLVADTAVTSSESTLTAPYTYFEQLQEQDDGYSVQEAAQKIVPLGPSELATFAGDVETGMRVINFLVEQKDVPIRDRLSSIGASLGHFDKAAHFLIASYENDGPCLWVWRSTSPTNLVSVPLHAISSAGSGRSYFDSVATNLGRNWFRTPVSDFMVILSAGLQAAAQHGNTMYNGVGGMFAVAAVGPTGIDWISDTSFIFYGPSTFDKKENAEVSLNTLASFFRDGTVVLATRSPGLKKLVSEPQQDSTGHPLRAKMIPSLVGFEESFLDIHMASIDSATNQFLSDYYVFLSRLEPRAVVVQAHSKSLSGKLVQAKTSESTITLTMKPQFLEYLLPKKSVGTLSAPAVVFVKR